MGWAARANTTPRTKKLEKKKEGPTAKSQDNALLQARARYEMIRARKRKKETP